MEQKTELKPCPFCGSKAIIRVIDPHTHIFSDMPDCDGSTFIECANCTCVISGGTRQEAAEAWNRRADNG